MKSLIIRAFCMIWLMILSANAVVAQDVIITSPKTKTAKTTAKPKPATRQKPIQETQPIIDRPIVSETFTVNGVSVKMILVEGLDNPFFIGETEVTQELWQAVMGNNPSEFKGNNRPVENVCWNDCKDFIHKLNSITGKPFRLPKESEWKFAAKGGLKSHGYEYSGSNTIEDIAWYDKNAFYCGTNNRNKSHSDYGTHNVKSKLPNELGIYDMSGNVSEWCEDLYDSTSSSRVNLGGGWSDYDWNCCVSQLRNCYTPDIRSNNLGLRLALDK